MYFKKYHPCVHVDLWTSKVMSIFFLQFQDWTPALAIIQHISYHVMPYMVICHWGDSSSWRVTGFITPNTLGRLLEYEKNHSLSLLMLWNIRNIIYQTWTWNCQIPSISNDLSVHINWYCRDYVSFLHGSRVMVPSFSKLYGVMIVAFSSS